LGDQRVITPLGLFILTVSPPLHSFAVAFAFSSEPNERPKNSLDLQAPLLSGITELYRNGKNLYPVKPLDHVTVTLKTLATSVYLETVRQIQAMAITL